MQLKFALVALLVIHPAVQADEPAITDKERILASYCRVIGSKIPITPKTTAPTCAAFSSGSPLVSDCPFSDQLGDADKLQVKRIYRNFSGGISHLETVVLKPEQYWGLVKLVEDRIAKRKASL